MNLGDTLGMEDWKLKLGNCRLKCKFLAVGVSAGVTTYWSFKNITHFHSKDFRTSALIMKSSNSSLSDVVCCFPQVSKSKACRSYFPVHYLEVI